MFRPQFVYPFPPDPCEDQKSLYSFDTVNTPALTGTLGAGLTLARIPLRMDRDSAFLCRGVKSNGPLLLRVEDPAGNQLSDSENATQAVNFENPSQWSNTGGAGLAVLDSGAGGVFAHAGGTFLLYLYNPTGSAVTLTTTIVTLHGVKRFPGKACV